MPSKQLVQVSSPEVQYTDTEIRSNYVYHTCQTTTDDNGMVQVVPLKQQLHFKTVRKPAKTGMMLVGWGGNNGTTVTAGILANKLGISWQTRRGEQKANYFGSITSSSTVRMGYDSKFRETYVPLNSIVPMVDPNELVLGGWDCSSMNLGDGLRRAMVLPLVVQDKLYPLMKDFTPLPALFDLEFVAQNQDSRANNVIPGSKADGVEKVRRDIHEFKKAHGLDKVIVLWTANTERWCVATNGVHDTADNILSALSRNEAELSPSSCYAIAAILEGCCFINGAPQNTIVPGIVELATRHGVFVAGDDFKSGQTKMKSALVEFFVAAGIKPECIASYNHLGNNDGKNLASPMQFRSKEITKSNVVDDMVASNSTLFPPGTPKPDHCIVIKYLPYVGDSKRALDEYIFSIFMGGEQCVVLHNTCEDSLLAAPLIIDLCVMTELMMRVEVAEEGQSYHNMHTVLSILAYLLKAPMVPTGTPVVNALNRQKQAIDNLLRALVGLPPDNNLMLECRFPSLRAH